MNLRQLFLRHIAQTTELPLMLEVERGEGIYLYDTQGKAYIDMISGISVSSLGHCHPAVVKAVQEQVTRYMHTMVYGEHIQAPQVQLATLLTEQLPDELNSVYFVNSGSEATEAAMKLAKRITGRREIIACRRAYHGSTQGSISLMSDDYFTRPFRPLLPDIQHIDFNCEYCLHKITERTACVIVETVQAESGVTLPRNDYLKKLRQRCDETGTLLVFDEIQVGYGRTGTLFAFEQYGVQPDILTLAKAMGGGMPIGAFVASRERMMAFADNPILGHITTFGGHPVTCAAALATLQTLLNTDHISTVKKKEKLIRDMLVHPAILDIRSAGFLMAVEFGSFDIVQELIKGCLAEGVIVDWFLFNNHCIRLAPPLIITEAEIRLTCEKLLKVIDKVYREGVKADVKRLSY